MGLFLTLFYIVIYYLSPAELFPALAPYRVQVITSALALFATLVIVLPQSGYPVKPTQNILLLGLLGTVLFSRVAILWLGGVLPALIEFGAVIIVFFLLMANAGSMSRIKMVSIMLIGIAAYYALMTVLASQGMASNKFLLEQVSGANDEIVTFRARGLGILNDPNDLAQSYLVAIALLGGFWIKRSLVRNMIVIVPLMALLVYGTSLTKSRGAMLTLGVVMMVWLARKINVVAALLMGAAGLVMLVALNFTGGRDLARDDGRLMAWSAAITMFKSHPVLGVGWNLFNEHHDLTTHNSYLLCLAELGTVGFFFWMSLVVVTMLQINQLISKSRQYKELEAELRLAVSIRLGLVAFLVSSWFLSRTYSMTLYILLAMATALVLVVQRRYPEVGFERPLFRRYASLTLASQVLSMVGAYFMIQARLL